MVRRAARTDDCQADIVKALRSMGVSVQDTSGVGKGFPDLCWGFQGRTGLLECKKPPGPRGGGAGTLTDDQVLWHHRWNGLARVVHTVDEALQAVLGRQA